MKAMPLFSILIANYNSEKYIREAIESCLNQTYKNIEIVIVDDCSNDESIKLIENFKSESIKLFKNSKNMGCGYTKRRCVEESKGEILGFLDDDDVLDCNAVECMVNMHAKNYKAALIFSTYYDCDESMSIISKHDIKYKLSEKSHLEHHRVTAFCTFKKRLYEKTEGIDKRYLRAVDQDLYYKMEEVGSIIYVDRVLYYYRRNLESISRGSIYNLISSRYWHFCAIQETYRRRGLDERQLEAEFYRLVMGLIRKTPVKLFLKIFLKRYVRWI